MTMFDGAAASLPFSGVLLMNDHIFNGWLVVLVQNCSDVARK